MGSKGVVVVQVMAPNRKIFALKRIKLQGKDSEASKGFVDEITLLQRLRGKQNIIQLVDDEVGSREFILILVFLLIFILVFIFFLDLLWFMGPLAQPVSAPPPVLGLYVG